VEFIRFGLLVTMTIALISVASRVHHHDSSPRAASGPSPSASPSQSDPSASASPSSPGQQGGGGGPADPGSSASGASGGTSGGAGTAVLPRTGPAGAAQLAALALILIGWGALSLTFSRGPATQPARRRRTGVLRR
jgi:hypothetical protein